MEIFGTIKDVLKTIFVKSVIKIRPKFSLYLFSAHSFLFFCHFYFNYLSLFLLVAFLSFSFRSVLFSALPFSFLGAPHRLSSYGVCGALQAFSAGLAAKPFVVHYKLKTVLLVIAICIAYC